MWGLSFVSAKPMKDHDQQRPRRQRRDLKVGMIRKVTSLSTLGAVDFRSDKERTAAYAKASRAELRKQTGILQRQAAENQVYLRASAAAQTAAAGVGPLLLPPPPAQSLPQAAWCPDPLGRHEVRWWDGAGWSGNVADGGIPSVDPLP